MAEDMLAEGAARGEGTGFKGGASHEAMAASPQLGMSCADTGRPTARTGAGEEAKAGTECWLAAPGEGSPNAYSMLASPGLFIACAWGNDVVCAEPSACSYRDAGADVCVRAGAGGGSARFCSERMEGMLAGTGIAPEERTDRRDEPGPARGAVCECCEPKVARGALVPAYCCCL